MINPFSVSLWYFYLIKIYLSQTKHAPPRYSKSKPAIALSASLLNDASVWYSQFSMCTPSKFLPTQEQHGFTPHQKLSRAVDNGGCISTRQCHHDHKPESSCQPHGRCGVCTKTHGNLGVLPIARPRLWACPKNCTLTVSLFPLRSLHCMFGCIIKIEKIPDYLRWLTMIAFEYANLFGASQQARIGWWWNCSDTFHFVVYQCGLRSRVA